jgi:hypothetical protein
MTTSLLLAAAMKNLRREYAMAAYMVVRAMNSPLLRARRPYCGF